MLSWLTGAKGADDLEDAFAEPPETPAPVFAVRAFKHAIFGTPAPATEDDIPSDTRPIMGNDSKPKDIPKPRAATTDASTRSKDDLDALALPSAPGLSPAKPSGILMTPGTTRRSKTVSFGAHVVDNEGKKQGRSGLPNTFPGKFPSPWTPKNDLEGLGQSSSRPRTKLTAQLHEVRDSAQKEKSDKIGRAKDDTDLTLDYLEPRSQSGKYWKREYDSYAEKTQREMKKLVVKQKAAKDYAKEKEEELTDLQKQLRQERLKVEKLETKTNELAAQMKDFEKRLLARTDEDSRHEILRLRAENKQLRQDLDQALGKKSSAMASPKRKTPKAAAAGDLWADAAFSSPFVHEIAHEQSPLQVRNLNIQDPTPKSTKRKVTKSVHAKRASLAEDSVDLSAVLPQLSPEPLPRPTPRNTKKSAVDMTIDELMEKYSPEKPQFDRLALPLGMGSSGSPSKPQKANTTKAEGKLAAVEAPKLEATVAPTSNEPTKAPRRAISDERKAQAQARINARKMAKAAA